MTCPFCGGEMERGEISAPARRMTWDRTRGTMPFYERLRARMEESVSIPFPVKEAYLCRTCRRAVIGW